MEFVDEETTLRGPLTASTEHASGPTSVVLLDMPALDVSSAEGADLRVLGRIGEGGMGVVHLAQQRAVGREVVIKRAKQSTPAAHETLLREGCLTGRLEHPNIVPVHLVGNDPEGVPAVVMKRVEGVSWQHLITHRDEKSWRVTSMWRKDPFQRHLQILLSVCDAIEFAHANGYIHRDIKPANVMLGAFGQVYVLDWGLAAPIGTRAFAHADAEERALPVGTPGYLAPEMATADGVLDVRTDVYLLGASLHRAIVGKARHTGADREAVMRSVLASQPFAYDEHVPPEIAAICNKAMHRDPDERFPTVSQLRHAVLQYLDHRASLALTDQAELLTRELRDQIAVAGASVDEAASSVIVRAFWEARFAYAQALREWPGNERAVAGLDACLEHMIGFELERGNRLAAADLLAELASPHPAFATKLAELEVAQSAERAMAEQLRTLAEESDLTVSRGQRIALLLVMAAIVGSGAVAYLPSELYGFVELTPLVGLLLVAKTAVVVGLVVLFGRRWLFRNAANRNVVALIGIGLVAHVVNRSAAFLFDIPMQYAVLVDLLTACAITAVGSLAVARGLWTMLALYGTAVVVGLLAPRLTGTAYLVAQVLAFSAGAMWITSPRLDSVKLARGKQPALP